MGVIGLWPMLVICGSCWLESVHGSELVRAENMARFATFNVSLYSNRADAVRQRVHGTTDLQAACLAEIIQRVRPDILLLNEVDYDPQGRLVALFQQNYLARGQNVCSVPGGPAEPIRYPYCIQAPSNTGQHSGYDLDCNGRVNAAPGTDDYPGDCWGYGRFPGQYAMVLLSRFPIDEDSVRTFRNFLWKDMPGALLPDNYGTEEAGDWFPDDVLSRFPLSSKSHWDVPIRVHGRTVHLLASHPTPPVFDGPEDRNGRRNHDEIRFWLDYIGSEEESRYIYDDHGVRGGLAEGGAFVILGDLNGDPNDGEGSQGMITRLLASPRILAADAPASDGAAQQALEQGGLNLQHRGDPRHDTFDGADRPGPGNLRLDYVLPSHNMRFAAAGVFWPTREECAFGLVGTHPFPGSDHRLVWVDLVLENAAFAGESGSGDAAGFDAGDGHIK